MKKLCDCGTCKRCKHRERMREWKEKNPEKWKAIQKRTNDKRKNTPEYKAKRREQYLRNRHAYIERAGKWQKENPKSVRERNRRWRNAHPEQFRAAENLRRSKVPIEKRRIMYFRDDLKKLYGVTPEWYFAKLEEQGNACAICGTTENTAKNRRMHVDHCHRTQVNRGILCHSCNLALERLESYPGWTVKALMYLERYK